MIRVTDRILLDEQEIHEDFIRAGGPGGQHVNKAATAVQLRFDVSQSPSLPDDVRQRLIRLAGRRMTDQGVLVIHARRFRVQNRNREDAMNRLLALIRKAAMEPVPRRPTRPTAASKRRRLEDKRRQGKSKERRRSVSPSDLGNA